MMNAAIGLLYVLLMAADAHKSCQLQKDTDAGYHMEFDAVAATTDAECCAICANDTQCTYATWDSPKGNGRCYLKSGAVASPQLVKGHSLCTCTDAPVMAAQGVLALLGIADTIDPGIHPDIGAVTKSPANPLFTQTEAWETNVNNGYPSVVYDPHEPLGAYRCWYDDHSASSSAKGVRMRGALAYANSSDGITWHKPALGIVDLGGSIGRNNNLVVAGNGIGVYLDSHETNQSRRFKGFGALGHSTSAGGGTIASADGLHWEDAHAYRFPFPQRYDTSNNLF